MAASNSTSRQSLLLCPGESISPFITKTSRPVEAQAVGMRSKNLTTGSTGLIGRGATLYFCALIPRLPDPRCGRSRMPTDRQHVPHAEGLGLGPARDPHQAGTVVAHSTTCQGSCFRMVGEHGKTSECQEHEPTSAFRVLRIP